MYLLSNFQHAIEPLDDFVDQRLLFLTERGEGLDDDRFAFQQNRDFAQAIGHERAAGRDQVANKVRTAEFRRYFDRAGEVDGLCAYLIFLKVI